MLARGFGMHKGLGTIALGAPTTPSTRPVVVAARRPVASVAFDQLLAAGTTAIWRPQETRI